MQPPEAYPEGTRMQYMLRGFTHQLGFRLFTFELIDERRVRTDFVVKADLNLLRKYSIPVQEAALLCRGLLEQRNQDEAQRTFTYDEAQMRSYANACAVQREAAKNRKAPRRAPSQNTGAAWRARPENGA